MDAAAHDRLLAYLSHLPQLTASALMQVVGDAVGQDGLSLAGRGLADTTRLASSPDDIWKDIAATNADEIGPALDALIEVLQALRADLAEGDRLGEVFTDARGGESGCKNAKRSSPCRAVPYPCVAAGISVTTVERSAGKYFLNTSCSVCGVTASIRSPALQNLLRVAAQRDRGLQAPQPVVVLLQRQLVTPARRFLRAIGEVDARPFLLQPLDLLSSRARSSTRCSRARRRSGPRCVRSPRCGSGCDSPTDTL